MNATKIILIFLGLIALAVLLVFYIKNTKVAELDEENDQGGTVVIGQELSDAQALEDERLAGTGGSIDSPFPAGGYESRKNEWGLLNPSPQDFDQSLREMRTTFVDLKSETDRSAFRSAISMDQFYTLRNFAGRSAVFALREKDPALLQNGLNALAMIDVNRMDWRDALSTIALLNYCAERLEIDPESAFETAANISAPRMAEFLRAFLKREPHSKDLEKSWLRREVNLDTGIGFVPLGGAKKYDPTYDLLALGMDIAKVLSADYRYEATDIEIATKLPPIWLQGIDDELVKSILSKTKGGMTVRAEPTNPGKGTRQMLVVFTVELDSEESARSLLDISKKTKPADDDATLGFVHNNLFSLIVSRSTIKGVESTEDSQSIQRFSEPMIAALGNAKTPSL